MGKNVEELKDIIIKFREDRDWKQFHKIKDLLLGLNIEVGELQELFLWKSDNEISQIRKSDIENEIADIFVFLIYICEEYGIDLETAVKNKLNINEQKYPVDVSKGSNKKYDKL